MGLNQINDYQKNILLNYAVKICGIVLSLLSARVTIHYLGDHLYGLWVTIASIVSWMSSGDFGIGYGLRNKYAEAYAEENKEKQTALLATGVSTLVQISAFLFFVGLAVCEGLMGLGIVQSELRFPLYITLGFFCINLVLSISQTISYGQQKSWYVTLAGTGVTFSALVAVWLLEVFCVSANLIVFAFIHGICSIIPNIILIGTWRQKGIDIFRRDLLKHRNKALRRDIVNVGMNFFGLQLCAIVLYSTDNVIINYLFDGSAVTKYSVITKIYDTGQNLFSIMLISLWSAVTYQAVRKNYDWIKREVKKLLWIWTIYVCGVVIVSLFLNPIVRIWIGPHAASYDPAMIILFAVYGITISFSGIFVHVVNGLNKTRLQLIIAVIGASLNIPLSVFFARNLGMGIFGVKLATLVAAILTAIAIPTQAWIMLSKKR